MYTYSEKRSYMYNFKIAQLHIQGCKEGLFFQNHSSCNSPMVGKIFLGKGRGGKIRAGEGVPSVCNFYGCCWFKDCIFIMISDQFDHGIVISRKTWSA